MSTLLRHIAGWSLLLLGVAGLVLPVLQGWLLIGAGALLLSPDVPFFRRLVDWIENRFPRLRNTLQRMRRRLGGGGGPASKS